MFKFPTPPPDRRLEKNKNIEAFSENTSQTDKDDAYKYTNSKMYKTKIEDMRKNILSYKVLNDKIRVIQGDGINLEMIEKILSNMEANGWCVENIAFGIGSALLQKMDRDTQKFAFKCSSARINGVDRDVYKKPITDPGKDSKAGRLKLIADNGSYRTVTEDHKGQNLLVEVFRDGKILKEYTLDQIRDNVENLKQKEIGKVNLLRVKEGRVKSITI